MKIHGETSSTNQASINVVMLALHAHITSYNLCNIYNMDETRLIYNMVLDQIIVQQQIVGYEKENARITIAFTQMQIEPASYSFLFFIFIFFLAMPTSLAIIIPTRKYGYSRSFFLFFFFYFIF